MKIGGYLDSSLIRVYNQPQTTSTSNSKEADSTQNSDALTSAEKSQIAKLQATDTAVRRHEAAHIAAGGSVIKSGANFTYQKGPDNKLYAVGGEVAIDASAEDTPQRTIPKMQTVRRAALAPSDPSSTDYQVAATASMMEMQARLELSFLLKEELSKKGLSQYANNETTSSNFSTYA